MTTIQPGRPPLRLVPQQRGDSPAIDVRTARTYDELHSWATAMDVVPTVVEEDWQSITYQAEADLRGTRVRYRLRDVLPRETALRRLARTYVVGMVHQVGDGECYHVREVIAPCLSAPEEQAREQARILAGARVEAERRAVCGATATSLRTHLVERAIDW
ncbi:hypothetical protein [Allosalinactinospora lopnorensis]|uniref:hypothetical protein n=1 Tax=Allosalinactinospora lopnorensis TaxID=1352348 RepID=UPI001F436372|nr:hypothetical protein [Allosalinactinospora lopnorensis]